VRGELLFVRRDVAWCLLAEKWVGVSLTRGGLLLVR
jgi:hypothetical protein